ncbi:ABC transporter ATP-binding protein [Pseudoruegeria sp. SHC-113]|uniref:ABC transporter ATP-binding protein n=1 Tax=Pseudoruegeria sp. SHC-113 TaxID=2855439 RepID=UPI0021BA6167|nr:ABC transporter ATP-binding protein [Pseudoruegeria sp. SHC-113]MCT8161930.1 ABC transporter ATP-binding protein [Pseudoruegeria sp. SHC-113]
MSSLDIKHLSKSYGPVQVLHDINLSIPENAFVVFVGPSGCGKSTLLRSIAGLEEIDSGEIILEGRDVAKEAPVDRDFAMVFQSYALYPQMSVRDNIGFALSVAGRPKAEIHQKVDEVAQMLRLTEYLDRKPADLSGGQRQRVAIGRAILRSPKAFLFDEPLSNLDAELRVDMRLQIAELRRQMSATFIYVTHDQVEAMTLADQIVVLRAGRIEQVGSPMELYHNPANSFVASFIGSPKMNLLSVADLGLAGESAATLGVRPEHLSIGAEGALEGSIAAIEDLGPVSYAYVDVKGARVTVQLPPAHGFALGEAVKIGWTEDALHRFDAEGQRI